MKTLFASFLNRNLGFFRLAVVTNLEYRLNFLTDVAVQPILTALIELTLWMALFRSTSSATIGGFGPTAYFSYAIWAAFIARITSNWMYEYRMIEEVDKGTINSILVRPVSFYEFYLSQFMGYKILTTLISLCIPVLAEHFFSSPTQLSRLPLALALVLYYLIFVHLISYCISAFAFFFNRVYSITVAKNLLLWLLSGELFPLDLVPAPWKTLLLSLPFCNAVYIPVAYLTGRIGISQVLHGFFTTTYSILILVVVARILWRSGLRRYAGTGA